MEKVGICVCVCVCVCIQECVFLMFEFLSFMFTLVLLSSELQV